ncbi:MAG: GNAT family N-acetyltransferase [Gemmatimonadota bacterium]
MRSDMPIVIRPAIPADAESLAAFAARSFAETYADANNADDMALHLATTYSARQQLSTILDPAVDVLVAEDAGSLAGYAQVRSANAPPCVDAESAVELWRFYVDRAWHGRGVARALMTAVTDAGLARGAGAIWLSVWEQNERAKAFYARSGYRRVGTTAFVLGTDVQTDWVMVREHVAPVTSAPTQGDRG